MNKDYNNILNVSPKAWPHGREKTTPVDGHLMKWSMRCSENISLININTNKNIIIIIPAIIINDN